MTQAVPPPVNLVPESAPFSLEQRSWLNGFFAGILSIDGVTALSPSESAALLGDAAAKAPADEDDGAAPWHDPTLPMAERMKLADGRPLRRRMMAAMAQQDCGQCGYNCNDYSSAIFAKKEARLNLCVPGGKETARMLKQLHAEMGAAQVDATARVEAPASPIAPAAGTGPSRDHPATATFCARTRLNGPGSEKETWHIEFDIAGTGLDYAVGDCLGVFPANDAALVAAVCRALGASPDTPIGARTLGEVLTRDRSLSPAPDTLFQLYSYLVGGKARQKARALAAGEDPDGDAANLDVLAAMEKFEGVNPHPEAFIEALEPLQPRLFSISSSPRTHAGRVSLTVDAVRYDVDGRTRLGVASTFLAERIAPGETLNVYVQKAQHFGLPADPSMPIIMIGPGTGVAPFRAFLHERMATKATGRNWLFFGHQRSASDFFYQDELAGMKAAGLLTRLSLAWSRDGDEKIYVQDRMRESGRELWAWLADGAQVYVCGGKRMAKDVELAFVDIVASCGARTVDEAIAFVADLKKRGRYQVDVY
jgi:sulfite reductase (NADPH) flavoprotein alpha-component